MYSLLKQRLGYKLWMHSFISVYSHYILRNDHEICTKEKKRIFWQQPSWNFRFLIEHCCTAIHLKIYHFGVCSIGTSFRITDGLPVTRRLLTEEIPISHMGVCNLRCMQLICQDKSKQWRSLVRQSIFGSVSTLEKFSHINRINSNNIWHVVSWYQQIPLAFTAQ